MALPMLVNEPTSPRGLSSRSRSTLASLAIHAALLAVAVVISAGVAVRPDERKVRLTFYDPAAPEPPAGAAPAPAPAASQPAPRKRYVPRKMVQADPPPPLPPSEPSPYDTPFVAPPSCTGPDCGGPSGGSGTGTGTVSGTVSGTGTGTVSGTGTGSRPPPMYLTPGMTRPRLIEGAQPQYTPQARRARVEGDLVVRIEIGEDGRVRGARIVRGLALLDDEVLRVVRSWRFSPPMHGGRPVPIYLIQRISFHLED